MNKSEIAEKAARRIWCIQSGCENIEVCNHTLDTVELAEMRIFQGEVERAIAESQPQPKIRWRTGKCEQDTRPHLENAYHICHNWRAELGDGEPSPPPDDIDRLAKEYAESHLIGEWERRLVGSLLADFAKSIRSGAAQEVSPPSPEQERDQLLFALGCQLGGVKSALEVIDAKNEFIEKAEGDTRELKAALSAAIPFIFEHGSHQNNNCYRGSDDGCHCGLDEAKEKIRQLEIKLLG